eukprot:6224872-Prymnesium_polylepis.1
MFKTVREGASPPTAACHPAAGSPAAKWPPACCQERGTEKTPRDGTKAPLNWFSRMRPCLSRWRLET